MKKVLVVEDDPIAARVLQDFLRANGFRTVVAKTGPEGLERFEQESPDLMLIDVLLPRKNGFELCFDVKRSARGALTRVLLMSAIYRDLAHAQRYAQDDLHADAFMVKPFELSELLARVKALLADPLPA
jgi:DNA-binding response OmpR family regulator